MGWDSNPRDGLPPAGFQDRCLQPLGHPSVEDVAGSLSPRRPEVQGGYPHAAEIHSGGDNSGKAHCGGRDAAFWPFTLVLMMLAR